MENARVNTNVRYEEWVKLLNRNTKFSSDSKVKPQAPSSRFKEKNRIAKREKNFSISENWLG